MTPTPKQAHRQALIEKFAVALAGSLGYELLDHGDGEVATKLAKRAVEFADAVLAISEIA